MIAALSPLLTARTAALSPAAPAPITMTSNSLSTPACYGVSPGRGLGGIGRRPGGGRCGNDGQTSKKSPGLGPGDFSMLCAQRDSNP